MLKVKPNKKEVIIFLKNLLLVILGTFILGFGVGVFILPYNLVTGGVPSLAIILNRIIPIKQLNEEIYITIFTWVLFFIGLIILGKGFALKTLTSSIIYPISVSLSSLLVDPGVFNGFFYLEGYLNHQEIAILLAAIFGGAFTGIGCALTFLGGGSTGGVDIIALSICKYFKKASSSKIIFLTDALLVVLGMFILNDFVLTLLGIVSAFICAIVIDKMFVGESKAFIAQIVTDKYEEINQAVIEKLDRTTTILDVTGGYSKQNKKMVMISFTMAQYAKLTTLISVIDRNAFMTIHRAHEINGEGFTNNGEGGEK